MHIAQEKVNPKLRRHMDSNYLDIGGKGKQERWQRDQWLCQGWGDGKKMDRSKEDLGVWKTFV